MSSPDKDQVTKAQMSTRVYWTVVIILFGFYLLAENYDWFGLGWNLGFEKIWPVFLIIVGISFIVKGLLK